MTEKKTYSTPVLEVHGNAGELTQGIPAYSVKTDQVLQVVGDGQPFLGS